MRQIVYSTSMNYWLERVVFKINASFLNGTLMGNWIPDQEDPEAESRALDILEVAGIIKSPAYFEGADYRILDINSGHALSAPTRQIIYFDYKDFLQFCAMNGLNPTVSGMSAQLKIIDEVEPVISIGKDDYKLKSLSTGSKPQRIIAYAYKKLGEEIGISALRENINIRQLQKDDVNLKQIFKDNVFGENGLLEAFAEIDKRTLLLKSHTLLTPSQVASIKKLRR